MKDGKENEAGDGRGEMRGESGIYGVLTNGFSNHIL